MAKKKLRLKSEPLTDELREKITEQAVKQFDAGAKWKGPRVEQWQKIEESYLNKVRPALKGRFSVPLPIMGGFVDTLLSLIDEEPRIKHSNTSDGGLLKARKMDAQWEADSSSMKANWARKDRNAKKMAAFTGVAIFKIYSSSDPRYKHYLEVVDPYDFICEPLGGSNIEDHRFWFIDNVFRSQEELNSDDNYNKEQVKKLVESGNDKDAKKNLSVYRTKVSRYQSLNMDGYFNDYVGDKLFRLTEGCTIYKGERYYIVFDHDTGVWIRCELLKDVFESNFYPIRTWATHEDPFNFWSKSPCDDIRPIAESSIILFNQALENRQKINWGQRAYDSNIFPDPAQLEFRPDGLVLATPETGQTIAQGIYEFKTPEVQGTIDMIQFMDGMLGKYTGISANAQGASDKDAKVGIYFGDMKQVAGRMGLYNKSYSECWEQLGLLYDWGLYEHMDEKMMVKVIGSDGIEWQELMKEDVEPDFNIIVVGSGAEQESNEILKQERSKAVQAIAGNPNLSPLLSQKWQIAAILETAGFDDDEVKEALDVNNEGDSEIIAEAADRIEQILLGKQPRPFRGANTTFLQKIVDFASDHEMPIEVFQKLMAYVDQHIPIATSNMVRKARQAAMKNQIMQMQMGSQKGGGSMEAPGPAAPPKTETPPNPVSNNAGMSADMSETMTPAMPV